MGLWRDSAGRLTFDHPGVTVAEYAVVCQRLAETFSLTAVGTPLVGPEQILWDFHRGESVVGLDWDIWMEFTAVAKTPNSEPLIEAIAAWLDSTVQVATTS